MLWLDVIPYLRNNKDKHSKEFLIQKLREKGYKENEIEKGVSIAYDDTKDFFWSKLISFNLILIFGIYIFLYFSALFFMPFAYILSAMYIIFLIAVPVSVLIFSVIPSIAYHKFRRLFYKVMAVYLFLLFSIIGSIIYIPTILCNTCDISTDSSSQTNQTTKEETPKNQLIYGSKSWEEYEGNFSVNRYYDGGVRYSLNDEVSYIENNKDWRTYYNNQQKYRISYPLVSDLGFELIDNGFGSTASGHKYDSHIIFSYKSSLQNSKVEDKTLEIFANIDSNFKNFIENRSKSDKEVRDRSYEGRMYYFENYDIIENKNTTITTAGALFSFQNKSYFIKFTPIATYKNDIDSLFEAILLTFNFYDSVVLKKRLNFPNYQDYDKRLVYINREGKKNIIAEGINNTLPKTKYDSSMVIPFIYSYSPDKNKVFIIRNIDGTGSFTDIYEFDLITGKYKFISLLNEYLYNYTSIIKDSIDGFKVALYGEESLMVFDLIQNKQIKLISENEISGEIIGRDGVVEENISPENLFKWLSKDVLQYPIYREIEENSSDTQYELLEMRQISF